MARLDTLPDPVDTKTARVRLRDITRAVTLGQEHVISGVDAQPYVIGNVIRPAGAIQSKLRLECVKVDADVAVYGAEIDVA